MRQRFMRFMQGRYGADDLNKFLLWVEIILLIISIFTINLFWWIALILMAYSYFRMFSRNIPKRYAENQKFLQLKERVKGFFGRGKGGYGGYNNSGSYGGYGSTYAKPKDKNHHIYKCPGCKQKIRIPKGKGKIEITCPKCGRTFRKRS